ncbi:hypothetical protein D915_001930 [Fasciola hepatica]|uniref:Egal-1 winged helix domain-containing protein n=1 Tax=Fasciola hepatica TaxID=6192 RepID=A0A4E0RIJ3_FASHE|nr:hypothetical protein D915_001930 [Fasciola hepatica]
MAEVEHTSDSELEDPNRITDAASCLDYLKRREVFLYKMMNDPSHKAMLYFLEVLMNSDSPVTVDQLAARFTHKSFSKEMREACGGGSAEGLREFLQRFPSLFNVRENGQVTSVSIELPGLDTLPEGISDFDLYLGSNNHCSSVSGESSYSTNQSATNAEPSLFSMTKQSKPVNGQRGGKPRVNGNTSGDVTKMKSTSSLSLASSPSNHSSQSSSGSISSFTGQNGVDQARRLDDAHGTEKAKLNGTGANNICRRVSNPNSCGWNKNTAVYQPPPLREQARMAAASNATCELCRSKIQLYSGNEAHTLPVASRTTCVHCPLLDLTCHHHCPATHHHVQTHCLCATTRLAPPTHCHHCYPLHAPTSSIQSNLMSSNYCALPPMEKLVLETEAVRFFQQRLLKREERWVPIKSLAGHLSQATPDVRAVVGPQLEFRNFLLKHPHVFEVQGELVSVRDPFSNMSSQRRNRDRFSGPISGGNSNVIHTSFSSNNLLSSSFGGSAGGFSKPSGNSERAQRPKSLILTTPQQLGALAFATSSNGNGRRHTEHRRSTHFAENFVTASYPASGGASRSGSTSSAPTTPTGSNPTLSTSHRGVAFKPINRRETIADGYITQSLISAATGVSSSTDAEPFTNLSATMPSLTTTNSISISMSANEYRAIMFLRKVLEKRGGAPGQLGLALAELMQFLSTKAPESVQSTIGWTKIELEEFVCQHNLFFDVRRGQLPKSSNPTSTAVAAVAAANIVSSNSNNNGGTNLPVTNSAEPLVLVTNKRLERMINIVITGTKPVEGNTRTLTNRCGRIFHVAKLWGIIDLGRHEHVFFDKSIFKHVDDLQKHFQVNELLYFNAILAPKESRAKWRATQVWKECDRENVEKLGVLSGPSFRGTSQKKYDPIADSNAISGLAGGSSTGSSMRPNGSALKPKSSSINPTGHVNKSSGMTRTSEHSEHSAVHPHNHQFNENEDTEADVDDLEVDGMSQVEKFPSKTGSTGVRERNGAAANESDCEFDLAGEEALDDEEESYAAALAREEGLLLANDVRFVTDANVLDDPSPRVASLPKEMKAQVTSSHTNGHISVAYEGSLSQNVSRSKHRNPLGSSTSEPNGSNFVSSSTEQNHADYVPDTHSMTYSSLKEDGTMSTSSTGSGGISIAVQTVSTGEIMATQLYHDPNKQPCSSA